MVDDVSDKLQPKSVTEEDLQRKLADDTDPLEASFRPAVGSLLYFSAVRRPDIAAVVRILTQETERPTSTVNDGAERAMAYLNR